MSTLLVAWQNLLDAATVAASSEVATLPGSNVQHPHLSRKWHTAAGVKSANLITDMGSTVSCSVGALLGTNLTASATVQWRASNTDATVTSSLLLDTGTVSAGAKAGYGASYKTWGAVSARYWRADIADSTLPDNLQVGRVFLGPSWSPTVNVQLGWSVAVVDPSQIDESWGGQTYSDARTKRRQLKFTLDFLSEAEMFGNAFALAYANGRVTDVLAVPDSAGSYLSEQAVFGLLQVLEPLVNPRIGLFRQGFTIKERL